MDYEESLALIGHMPLLNLETGTMICVNDIPHSPPHP
jgi:hypothetical protein